MTARPDACVIVTAVVQQHADSAAELADARAAFCGSAYASLSKLERADRRLSAHLDGLRLAGEAGARLCSALLERPSGGVLFALAVLALERNDIRRLDELIVVARAVPETLDGLLAAFGWVSRGRLRGTVADLLADGDPFKRMLGIAVCAMHRVDPGSGLRRALESDDPMLRARSVRTVGELGLRKLAPDCEAALRLDAPEIQSWAAWSLTLLDGSADALRVLTSFARSPGPRHARALRLALQAMELPAAHRFLRELAGGPEQGRRVIEGSGVAGDAAYVPWLIKQMKERHTARLAAEAFALVCGVDLETSALDRPAPENFESGPTDDPDDPNVDMDPDDGLPWPDVARIEAWWAANSHRFQKGTRYFMGAPVTREHCVHVLKTGYQRQRILAAHYLCLLEPGTPLFNTSAPAWRQQKLLARL